LVSQCSFLIYNPCVSLAPLLAQKRERRRSLIFKGKGNTWRMVYYDAYIKPSFNIKIIYYHFYISQFGDKELWFLVNMQISRFVNQCFHVICLYISVWLKLCVLYVMCREWSFKQELWNSSHYFCVISTIILCGLAIPWWAKWISS
jgi:hypothetical protein